MSRSNPQITNNPTERYFEWDGTNGHIKYYDKEKKENINPGMPFVFMFLDQLARVGGYDPRSEQNIWSNEVRSTQKETFTVRSGNQILSQGLYSDIKKELPNGAKYVSSIYIAYKEGEEYKIGNLQVKGSALSQWMDFMKQHQKEAHEGAIKVELDPEIYKSGNNEYRIPIFKINPISDQANQAAIELDKVLQEFLEAKTDASEMAETPKSDTDQPPVHSDSELPDMDDLDDSLPF